MKFQKIKCNVTNCTHNCLDDCTCRLDEIHVASCINKKRESQKEDITMCNSFQDIGDLNVEEKKQTLQ